MLGKRSPLSHTPALFLFYLLHFIYYVSCVYVSGCAPQYAQVEPTRQPAGADPNSGAPWEDLRGLTPCLP